MPDQPDRYAKITGFVDEAKVVDVIYLDLHRNLAKFTKDKCKVLRLGGKKILRQYRLGSDSLDRICNIASSFGTPSTR
ncbi:mitochondrial enolase superfamily member 1 [Grus japonensis]|uniref:Mitochondrial enolase superfamily member 1 n=1 Tax=Grus japonensis TaxID=30415 RepID=A0ABC9VRE5_GRUJA